MSNYLPSVSCESEFEGDLVTYDLEPIESADFRKLLPFFKENDDGSQSIAFDDQPKFMEVAEELLSRYASNFSGLNDGKGAAIPLETVLKKAYFIGLVSSMIGELFSASMVNEVERKNSEEPSGPS